MEREKSSTADDVTISRRLAEFVVGLPAARPAAALERMRLHVLDTFGCQLAFAALPWSRDIWRYVQDRQSIGPATLAVYGDAASSELAAFANAAFTHGFEMDDTEMATTSHPGTVVVPVALALAQETGASGDEFLTAVLAGYETMIRVGLGGVGMPDRGFHTTAVVGAFGAAAAAALLLGLTVEQTTHAFGICATRAAGISEFTVSGGTEKRLHGAFGAQAGIEAARLALAGVSAPSGAIEGQRGLLRAVTATPDPDRIVAGLGREFVAATTGMKQHCCCGGQHAALDAVADLAAAHGFGGDEIAGIRIRLNPREYDAVANILRPRDVISSQFSVAFGIGLSFVSGANGFRNYVDADLEDPRILAIADLVTCERLEPGSLLEGFGPADVEITLKDGTVHTTFRPSARGMAGLLLNEEQVVQKFLALATGVLGRTGAEALAERTLRVDELPDVDQLARLLVAPADYTPRDYSALLVGVG